jgi:hypothetical protein
VERGEPDDPLTGAWEAERRSSDGGEGGGSQNSDAGRARGSESGKWGGRDGKRGLEPVANTAIGREVLC